MTGVLPCLLLCLLLWPPLLLDPRPSAALTSQKPEDSEILRQTVIEAHRAFKDLQDGANADYIPELAEVPSALFGLALVTSNGETYTAGDADYIFSIQSVSKPFTVALLLQESGSAELVAQKIGLEPTGQPFNSILAIETLPGRTGNPLVNAGAIAAVSLVQADSAEQRFSKIKKLIERFAAAKLELIAPVYRSEAATNHGNRAMGFLLQKYGRIYADPVESVDVYTRQCSLGVTARQLAVMGATLANEGVNPISGERVLERRHTPTILSLMLTAGFYDESGAWSCATGLPAKTGVGGGVLAVAPGKLAIAAFSPRLNKAGNSIKSLRAIEYLGQRLGLNVFDPVDTRR
jgi:glutaminase